MSKKKTKKKGVEEEVDTIKPDILSEVVDRPILANPNVSAPRPFHKPTLSGSVRPFGGRR